MVAISEGYAVVFFSVFVVCGLDLGVQGLGFGVRRLGIGIWGQGFGGWVWGCGMRGWEVVCRCDLSLPTF